MAASDWREALSTGCHPHFEPLGCENLGGTLTPKLSFRNLEVLGELGVRFVKKKTGGKKIFEETKDGGGGGGGLRGGDCRIINSVPKFLAQSPLNIGLFNRWIKVAMTRVSL